MENFQRDGREPHAHHDVLELNLHSSEEEYIGSSEDDEDFIIPAKYVRITTVAEILAHRIQLPISSSSEEVKLDPRLVSEHLYMGSDMEFITQPAASLEEGRVYELLALVQSGIVTFPEHILPLVLFSPSLISALRSVFNDLKVIALIPAKPNSSTADPSLAQYGTTAEVYEYSGSEPGLRLKTRVKQRFKVIATWIDEYENLMARVKILPEKSLSPMQPWLSSKFIHQRTSLIERAVLENSWTNYRNSLDTKVSPLAGWVLQQFDCHSLAARVRLQIKKLMAIDDSSMELVPTEPHSLSFWAANNLLMDDEGRLKLLEEDNIIYRLRTVLELISKRHVFSCCVCSVPIADHTDVILICSQGTSLFFNNPRTAQVRKVMTFRQVQNIRVVSRPSVEFSWFPGYAWSPGECSSCRNHLGWYITSAATKQMKPKNFWVLCSESLQTETIAKSSDVNVKLF
ncbi:putative protein cereblon-like [Daphnia sinensis]|uniref:Protein cereblon n=1 Tax=Daphnia sinensis TaxID=1820382 RepID=A0AAD5L3D4_9CRUS|nr:putative protein cereblon-like [Daphnia sinensis]